MAINLCHQIFNDLSSSYWAGVQGRDIELTRARSDGSFTDMSRSSQFIKSIQASMSSNAMDTKNSQHS